MKQILLSTKKCEILDFKNMIILLKQSCQMRETYPKLIFTHPLLVYVQVDVIEMIDVKEMTKSTPTLRGSLKKGKTKGL